MSDHSLTGPGFGDSQVDAAEPRTERSTLGTRFAAQLHLVRQHPMRHLMILVVIAWLLAFHYVPIYGITLAFISAFGLVGERPRMRRARFSVRSSRSIVAALISVSFRRVSGSKASSPNFSSTDN